jgi:plasmid maintenance system killer protein
MCPNFFSLKVPMKKKCSPNGHSNQSKSRMEKTLHTKLQYGRAARHKDVLRCAIGQLLSILEDRALEDVIGGNF